MSSYQQTDSQNYGFSYGYNLASQMTSETYLSLRQITTTYDAAGRISTINGQKTGEPNKTYASQFSYAAHGAVKSLQLGNLKWEHANFNSRLQPLQIGLGTSATNSSILQLDYGYGTTNNNGNVLSQTITTGATVMTQSYGYDALNRLSSAGEGPAWSQTYDCDRYGNRAVRVGSYIPQQQLTPQSTSPTDFSAFNQSTNKIIRSGFGYDAAGNLTADPTTAANAMVYDGENRLVSYTKAGVTTTYSYDGDGRRVKKVDITGTIIFVYNAGGQLIAEYTSGTPSGGGTSYLTSDHLGSTRVVTKSDGTLKARYDYLPFGEELGAGIGQRTTGMGYGGADLTRQKFTQKERDGESGLDYFLARYYSSAQGRFTSRDPYNIIFEKDKGRNEGERQQFFLRYASQPQVWNKYTYMLNNPFKYTDPDGRRELTDEDRARLNSLLGEYNAATSAHKAQLANAIGDAIREISEAIDAVPEGQQDPENLRATFYAIDHLGDTRYASDGSGSALHISSNGWTISAGKNDNKCNFFVGAAYALGAGIGLNGSGNNAGIPVSGRALGLGNITGDGNLPSANTWAAGAAQNFRPVTSPSVGDVAAWRAGMGAGHSGIYAGGGAVIYASDTTVKVQTTTYVNNYEAQHGGGSVSYQRYVKP